MAIDFSVNKLLGEFQCSHRLSQYDGACANIHGHSYRVSVSYKESGAFDAWKNSRSKMLLDFAFFKPLKVRINNMMDHRLLMNKDDELVGVAGSMDITLMDGDPTAENIAYAILCDLARMFIGLPDAEFEVSVCVEETSTCFAEITAKSADFGKIQEEEVWRLKAFNVNLGV